MGNFVRILLICCGVLIGFSVVAQNQNIEKKLVEAGYENVSRTLCGNEEIITLEASQFITASVAVKNIADIANSFKPLSGITRRIVLLETGVPVASFVSGNNDMWRVTYDLGENWSKAARNKKINSSLFKVDLVVHPQLAYKNAYLDQVYEWVFNLSPALEMSPLPGMKLTAQLIIPIYNDRMGRTYSRVRPGHLTLQQTVRIENLFAEMTLGCFDEQRWGVDLAAWRPLAEDGLLSRFSLMGRVGLTGFSSFYDWKWYVGSMKLWTWNFGASYYNKRYNAQIDLKYERFLAGDRGVRCDVMRHFANCSIGVYAMLNNYDNFDAGFRFAIALPPFKNKRGKYARIRPARYFKLDNTMGSFLYRGHSYTTRPANNIAERNYNPSYLDSYLR
jgi:hypothetical protein